MSSYLIGIDEEEMAEKLLLTDMELLIYIGSNNTFAYVNMFEDEELAEAAMLVWEDGCLDFGDKRGLYKASFGVESGFEEGGFALYFEKFEKVNNG